ncbi:MAG: glycosyltransferase [Actinomycetota bacterium]|nr:glycosyltransferase [Actinomycetota bacterium]
MAIKVALPATYCVPWRRGGPSLSFASQPQSQPRIRQDNLTSGARLGKTSKGIASPNIRDHGQVGAFLISNRSLEPGERITAETSPKDQRIRTPSPPTVSVVICAYTADRWNQLLGAIHSVQNQTTQATEIIVVADHELELYNRLKTAVGSTVTVLENRQRQGLSGARNTGMAAARGEIVAFLDDDAEAAPDWLAALVEGYDDPTVFGTGGLVEPLWPRAAPEFPSEFYWVIGCSYTGMPTTRTFIRNMIGANMSFRRQAVNNAGGFKDGIGRVGQRPVGCEETELCIRIRQAWPQGRVLYEPRAVVHHHVPSSRLEWRYFVARCYSEGISKALLCRLGGAEDGLSSERSYVLRALPRGFIRGITDGLARADRGGFVRSAWIAGGLLATVTGYIVGSTTLKLQRSLDA